jgi:hypothetical protein
MSAGQGFARTVTLDTLPEFQALLRRADATPTGGDVRTVAPPDPEILRAEERFAGEPILVTVPFQRPRVGRYVRRPTRTSADPAAPPPPQTPATAATPQRGAVIWRKILEASDVQRQPGHATGCVRLVQADFTIQGHTIDQTTYFRNDVFGNLQWQRWRVKPPSERTAVGFDITVLGAHWGVHRLNVSHKPSGEAGQSNYTSSLHWKPLGARIKAANLTGHTLTLYRPAPGTQEPFFIDIT